MNDESKITGDAGDKLPDLNPPEEPGWLEDDRQSFEAEHDQERELPSSGDVDSAAEAEQLYTAFASESGVSEQFAPACREWADANVDAFTNVIKKTGDLGKAYEWARDGLLAQGVPAADVQCALEWYHACLTAEIAKQRGR